MTSEVNDVHVVPMSETVADHDVSGEDCRCAPDVESVSLPDGTFGWVITHHRLAG